MKILSISATNIQHSQKNSMSLLLCNKIAEFLNCKEIQCEVIDLRDYTLHPCIGCGKCFSSKRCSADSDFNKIYNKITRSDGIYFISPHYAPIPAKLSMVLEKMEQITFLHWWKDNTYKSELYGLPAGIISHGGGSDWALKSYKAMVNDTIANALDTIQCKVVPYDEEWNTGISIPVQRVMEDSDIFPIQEYDWPMIDQKIKDYIEIFLRKI